MSLLVVLCPVPLIGQCWRWGERLSIRLKVGLFSHSSTSACSAVSSLWTSAPTPCKKRAKKSEKRRSREKEKICGRDISPWFRTFHSLSVISSFPHAHSFKWLFFQVTFFYSWHICYLHCWWNKKHLLLLDLYVLFVLVFCLFIMLMLTSYQ